MNDKLLKQDIIKISDIIRRKYKALKSIKDNKNLLLEDTFKPITNQLKDIVKGNDNNIKKENDENYDNIKIKKYKKEEENSDEDEEEGEGFASAESDLDEYNQNNTTLVPSSDYYLQLVINKNPNIDFTYGVYYASDSKQWKIGSNNIQFNSIDESFDINNKKYGYSPGLYELLFMKNPNNYTKLDLNNYSHILNDSSAYRRNYDPTKQINGSKSLKYKNIISKIIQQHSGDGLLQYKKHNNKDYVYWNDPNELVERLKLLIASQNAGHNNHNNEIISIIEELRESKIII